MAGAMAVSVATNIGGFVEEAAGSFVMIPFALLESPYLSANMLSEIGLATGGLAAGGPRSAAIKALSSTGRRTSSVTASLLVAVRLARETVRTRCDGEHRYAHHHKKREHEEHEQQQHAPTRDAFCGDDGHGKIS